MSMESGQNEAKRATKRRKFSQERLMIMFTLYFILGVLLLVFIPEGHAVRGIAMALYSVAVLWSMFRFAL